jgi:N-acyl-D-aspartate/D-glutamate deacylase
VLGRHAGTTLQAIIRFDDPDPAEFKADVRRLAAFSRRYRVRGQWTAIPSGVVEAGRRDDARELHREFQAEGIDFWPMQPHMASRMYWNFERSLVYFRIPAWNEVINGPTELKLPTLADPAWRDKARWDWEHRERSTNARIEFPHNLIFAVSETGAGPLGISLTDYARQLGVHISDALAEWICNNGLGSMIRVKPDEFDDQAVVAGVLDPHVLTNINDTGAHLQLFCGAGQNVHLLTHYVRDQGSVSIEDAVHALAGKAAAFFGFRDRGVLEQGRAADLAVFALDEIELPAEVKSYDVPGGSWRFTRPSAGFRATVVNGVPTFTDDGPTSELPGRMISPS